jgi:integrase
MATIQRRSTRDGHVRYRAQVRIKNQPWVSATFHKRSDATKWARETESAQITGAYAPTPPPLRYRISDAVDRYRCDVLSTKSPDEKKRQWFQLRRWRDLLGDRFVDDVTPGAIARVRDQLMGDPYGLAPATVVRYLAVLSHLYTVASSEWEWLESNPVRRVRRPKLPRGRVRFLDKDELSALLSACQQSDHPCLYPIVVLAVSTGMRHGEILGLRWQDVDLVRNRITLEQTKNGDRRSVPLVGRARAVISEYAKVRRIDTPLVFPSRRKPTVPADLRKPWARAVEMAGLEDFRFEERKPRRSGAIVLVVTTRRNKKARRSRKHLILSVETTRVPTLTTGSNNIFISWMKP